MCNTGITQFNLDHPHLQGQVTLTSSHPVIQDLLQKLGPLFLQMLPIILASLLGDNTPTPPPAPAPTPAPEPTSPSA
jgi:hypothetical protein